MLHWKLRAFAAPRQGYSEREYEDAWDCNPARQESGAFLRLAIADGATASSFAREWAELLARDFVRRRFVTVGGLKRTVTRVAPFWWRMVFSRPLPWYAEEKARRGAFSSLLGLHLDASPDAFPFAARRASSSTGDLSSPPRPDPPTTGRGSWQAVAVGDSCLFQVRGDSLLAAFPLQSPEQFSDTPALISSHLARNGRVPIHILSGRWQPGDAFILATDALAAWFLAESRQESHPWRALVALTDLPTFHDWLGEQRASGRIRNDDVTCLFLQMEDASHDALQGAPHHGISDALPHR